MNKTLTIDPKIFISPPYITCTNCEKENCYGVLMIDSRSYTRRCKECWATETYKLPLLEKKIIYLDQFAISQMMKAVNSKLGKSAKIDKYWFKVFEKLEMLSKLQLIICPDSTFQSEESIFHDRKGLKRMYEQFSQGVSFHHPSTIKQFQLVEHFKKHLNLHNEDQNTTKYDVINGDIEGWQNRLLVSIDYNIDEKEINEMKSINDECDQSLIETFNRWKKEKDKKFKDWYIEEGMAWGKIKVAQYVKSIMQPNEDYLSIMSEENIIISSLLRYIPNNLQSGKGMEVFKFLLSKKMLEVPFNKISSLLWAGIANQAAHGGRKRPPNSGMINDIGMVSILLPYCDALFVDNEMRELLKQGAVKKEIDIYPTRIFSLSDRNSFIDYLDEIKKQASEDHLKKVVEVYGEDWGRPYWSMYDKH